MKTVGNLIKEARFKRNISMDELAEMTHIKVAFIKAIEESAWNETPEFNITLGFVKSIAHFLDIDEFSAISLFRREYVPDASQNLNTNRHKELGRKFVLGPRIVFLFGVLIIFLVVFGYLGFQYKKFSSPPSLYVYQPIDGQKVIGDKVDVKGKTDVDAVLFVNNEPVVLDNNGGFSFQIDVSKSTSLIDVVAKSRSGKVNEVKRRINVQ